MLAIPPDVSASGILLAQHRARRRALPPAKGHGGEDRPTLQSWLPATPYCDALHTAALFLVLLCRVVPTRNLFFSLAHVSLFLFVRRRADLATSGRPHLVPPPRQLISRRD